MQSTPGSRGRVIELAKLVSPRSRRIMVIGIDLGPFSKLASCLTGL